MKVTRTFSPYKADGKRNITGLKKKSGVYLIYKNDKLRYIGYSETDLYTTMYHHFTEWNDKTQVRVTYVNQLKHNDFKVRIVLCPPSKAAKLERALIIKHKPIDNPDKLRGYTATKAEEKALDEYNTSPVLPRSDWEEAPF